MNPQRDRGIRTENEACRMLEELLHLPHKAVNRRKNEGIPEDIGDLIGVPGCTIQVTRCKDDLRPIADRARTKLADLHDQQGRAGTRHGVVLLRIDGAGRRPGVWRAIVGFIQMHDLRGPTDIWSRPSHVWHNPQGWIIRHAPDVATGGWHQVAPGRYVATIETWCADYLAASRTTV